MRGRGARGRDSHCFQKPQYSSQGGRKPGFFQKVRKSSTKSPTDCDCFSAILNSLYTHTFALSVSLILHTDLVLEVQEETQVCS